MWKNNFRAERDGNRVTFYEPLKTSAPQDSYPYCYMGSEVMFCADKYHLEEIENVTSQWNLLGTRWTDDRQIGFSALAPFVWYDGQVWELISGQVLWVGGWHNVWEARLVREDDPRLTTPLMREQTASFQGEQ